MGLQECTHACMQLLQPQQCIAHCCCGRARAIMLHSTLSPRICCCLMLWLVMVSLRTLPTC
jgi:hypothetical protein